MASVSSDSLTDRELLLLLNDKIERLEGAYSQISDLRMKVVQLETKITMYSAMFGIISTVASSLIVYFLTKA
jgi:hypothetical protein